MEAKAGLPLAWISVCSDCLASDRFECFDEFGHRSSQAFLLLGPETLERIADVQAGPALVPRLGFQTLAERLLEEQEIIRHVLEQAAVAVGIARLEVEPQFDSFTAVVYPQLEM